MLKELIAELKKYDRTEIAYKSGVSASTLDKILCGANTNPKLSTLEALQGFLDSKKQEQTGE